jgi:hypothetical protein
LYQLHVRTEIIFKGLITYWENRRYLVSFSYYYSNGHEKLNGYKLAEDNCVFSFEGHFGNLGLEIFFKEGQNGQFSFYTHLSDKDQFSSSFPIFPHFSRTIPFLPLILENRFFFLSPKAHQFQLNTQINQLIFMKSWSLNNFSHLTILFYSSLFHTLSAELTMFLRKLENWFF